MVFFFMPVKFSCDYIFSLVENVVFVSLRAPLSVDLESKHLARDMERLIQGTTLTVSNKGSCWYEHYYFFCGAL